jgi:hypothetical protein
MSSLTTNKTISQTAVHRHLLLQDSYTGVFAVSNSLDEVVPKPPWLSSRCCRASYCSPIAESHALTHSHASLSDEPASKATPNEAQCPARTYWRSPAHLVHAGEPDHRTEAYHSLSLLPERVRQRAANARGTRFRAEDRSVTSQKMMQPTKREAQCPYKGKYSCIRPRQQSWEITTIKPTSHSSHKAGATTNRATP